MATVLIEIDGADAIDWLEAAFLTDGARDFTTLEAVYQALSLHGGRETAALRARVVEAYGVLVAEHPVLETGDRGLDGAAAYAVAFYLGAAREAAGN